MKLPANPIALRAYENALRAGRKAPKHKRKRGVSREADKFVVRGYRELFDELSGIGLHEGRSANSEMVAGVLAGLSGFEREQNRILVTQEYLGEELSGRVLAGIPTFDLSQCKHPANFVIRFPPQVRDTVRLGVEKASTALTMNQWLLDTLVAWVEFQRRDFALLSAAISYRKSMRMLK